MVGETITGVGTGARAISDAASPVFNPLRPFVTTFTTMLIASRWGSLGLLCRLHCCADNLRCLLERLLGETRFLVAIKHLVRWRREYICHGADDKVGVFALVYLSVFFQNGMHQITVRIQGDRNARLERVLFFQSPLSSVLNRAEGNGKSQWHRQ